MAAPSITDAAHETRREHARLASDPGHDTIFQLLVAARRTLEQVDVLAEHYQDAVTDHHVTRAMNELSLAMDVRVMRDHS